MENITLGAIAGAIAIITPIVGILWCLFKIYSTIKKDHKITIATLKAVTVMLDHFIQDKVGNGEFKTAREEIADILIKE